MGNEPPRVVPLHAPNAAETMSILAEAMGYAQPSLDKRGYAGSFPVSDDERSVAASLYAGVRDAKARQAVLDVLAAIVACGQG